MSKTKLIHIVRPRPVWATGKPMTICGNISVDADLTASQMASYVKRECRGSVKVAYGSCCVTCLEHNRNIGWRNENRSEQFQNLFDYLERSNTRKHPEHGQRIDDEVQAVAELIERHGEEFRAIVQRRVDLREYVKAGAKPKLVGGKSK